MPSRESSVERLCESCPERSICTEICEQVERILSDDDTGKTWREKPWGFSRGNPGQQAAWGLTDDSELYRLFWYSWDKLAPRQREALMLRRRGNMSFKEMGNAMGISKTAAFKLYQKAFRGLTHSP
jgi:DNA-directed RNA polymerase specialized sigma24 family protein